MKKTYGSSTEDYLRNIPYKTDTDKILKEIAQNLAYIADELSDMNGHLHNIDIDLSDVVELVEDDSIFESEEDEDGTFRVECVGAEKCFICGKSVDLCDCGGMIVDSDGNTTCACADCKPKFDAIIGDIVGRKVRC